MRRWLGLAAIGSVLMLAGCSLPPGVDGNLVDDWSPISAPHQVTPKVGDCRLSDMGDLVAAETVDCTTLHEYETVYVGAFTGSDAARVTTPPAGSPAMRSAYAKCQAPATRYLGAEWHTGEVSLIVVVPDNAGWTGGARWFECEVGKTLGPETDDVGDYGKSFRGALAPGGPLRLSCVDWILNGTSLDDFAEASCTALHNGQFAGVFTAPDIPYPSDKAFKKLASPGCEAVVGKFLGFHGANDYGSSTVGWAWGWVPETQWNAGDRSIRCYADAYTKDRQFIGSVKGIRGARAKG